MKKKTLSQLIYDDPAYSDLAKLVGYREVPFPLGKDESQALLTKYGKDKMMQVAEELLDFDLNTKFCKLKAVVRVRCLMLLGPSPEEWDAFYRNVIHKPPNPYKSKSPEIESASIEEPPADLSEIEQLRNTHGRMLRTLLLTEHSHLTNVPHGEPAHDETIRRIELIEAEMRRRKQKIPKRPQTN